MHKTKTADSREETERLKASLDRLHKVREQEENQWKTERRHLLKQHQEVSEKLEQSTIRFQQEFNLRQKAEETVTNLTGVLQIKEEKLKGFEEFVSDEISKLIEQLDMKPQKNTLSFSIEKVLLHLSPLY